MTCREPGTASDCKHQPNSDKHEVKISITEQIEFIKQTARTVRVCGVSLSLKKRARNESNPKSELPYQRLALVVLQPGLELPYDVFLDLDVIDVFCQHL